MHCISIIIIITIVISNFEIGKGKENESGNYLVLCTVWVGIEDCQSDGRILANCITSCT